MAMICRELRENPRRVFVWQAPYRSFEELETRTGEGSRDGCFQQSYACEEHLCEPDAGPRRWLV